MNIWATATESTLLRAVAGRGSSAKGRAVAASCASVPPQQV